MTGNGLVYTTYKMGDDWWMVYDCVTHIIVDSGYEAQ